MTTTTRRSFLQLAAGSSAVLMARPALSAPAIESTDYSEVIERLEDAIARTMNEAAIPGLAISLVDRDRLVWAQGFGHTDRSRRQAVTTDTRFGLQSISKTYTATAVLGAVSDGLLDLDDPLKKHLPGWTIRSRHAGDQAAKITLRHLLSHRSGLCHEAPLGNNYDSRPCSFEDHIRSISRSWLLFAVGERHSYSNLGIDLAGYVLQLKRKQSFATCMRESLLEPLGMAASTYDQTIVLDDTSVARGHRGDFETPRQSIPMLPAGGLYSTARDTARFLSFQLAGGRLRDRQLIPAELLDEMARPQFPIASSQAGGCGLGIFNVASLGTTRLVHNGGGYGFSSHHTWLPEYGLGVAILCNQQNASMQTLATQALWMMVAARRGQVSPTPVYAPIQDFEVMLRPAQLQRLTGTYRRNGSVVTVQADGPGLALLSGSSTVRLRPHAATEFFAGSQRYLFDLEQTGNAQGIRVIGPDYNENFVEYWPLNDSPQDAPGPELPEWREFVGRYVGRKYGQDAPLAVFAKNGFLYLDWEGGLKLNSYRPGLFFTADGEAVEFQRDALTLGNRPFAKVCDALTEP